MEPALESPNPDASLELHPVIQDLLGLINDRAAADRREALSIFARAFTRRLSDEELAETSAEELYARTSSAFDLADSRGTAPAVVRVFNPDPSSDGYGTTGTVIETKPVRR